MKKKHDNEQVLAARQQQAIAAFNRLRGAGSLVAGLDEVGRGPLLGPVVAAAVVLDPTLDIAGLTDSKKLSEKRREVLAQEIKKKALFWAVGRAEVEEIDELNILHASLLAMRRAYLALPLKPQSQKIELAMVDGNRSPELPCEVECVVKGDLVIPSISAASIIAKVERDQEMQRLHETYPDYGIAQHKGYPTKLHREILQKRGPLPIHRRSFGPVKKLLA